MTRRSYRNLVVLTCVVLLVGAGLGQLAHRWALARRAAFDSARIQLALGDQYEAEASLWRLLQTETPTIDRFVLFLDAHDRAMAGKKPGHLDEDNEDDPHSNPYEPELQIKHQATVDDGAIDVFVNRGDLPEDFEYLARYAWESRVGDVDPETTTWVTAAADRTPPLPWANRLLADEAAAHEDSVTMAERLMREGRYVPNHHGDIAIALEIYADAHDYASIAQNMIDPAVQAEAGASLRARVAVETNAWKDAIVWSFRSTFPRPPTGPLVLAAIAALAWGVFCAQLGKVTERPYFRIGVYVVAFALGTLSVVVTDLFILIEEAKLHLVESGDPLRDFLYYTFGVGFREELSKLLLFAPLLPVLRKRGKKIDVLVAGAFVGLGFAAVENLSYLQSGDLTTATGRFLTANFLHMSMTAILANALDDFLEKGDAYAPEMSKAALSVMGMHGLYDFFIAHRQIGGGYLSMLVFFLLVNRFLLAVDEARGRASKNEQLLDTYVLGIAVVLSASYVWASYLVGPAHAALACGEGILGSIILIVVFANRFRQM